MPASPIGLCVAGAGLLVVLTSVRALGPAATPLPRPRERSEVVVRGPYGVVRHPIYTGVLLLALGLALAARSVTALAVTVLLAVFFELKSRLEEGLLLERDPGYAQYRRRVRRKFVPGLY